MNFSFVGKLGCGDTPVEEKTSNKTGSKYMQADFSIAAADNNRVFLKIMGSKNDTISTQDTDKNNIEIAWADQFDSEVLETVANWRKLIVDLGDNRREFITTHALIEYLSEHFEELKGKQVLITGSNDWNIYEGSVRDSFTVKGIYAVDEERKPQLKATDIFYFNKESLDTEEWSDLKRITLHGYVNAFINKKLLRADKGANRYIPFDLVIDCSKFDFDNESHIKKLKGTLLGFGLKFEDGKIKASASLKSSKMYKQAVELSYINGAQEVEISESDLTDYQRELISFGVKELKDFIPRGSRTFGDRITEYRLKGVNATGDYAEGYVTLDESVDDFEKLIYAEVDEEETIDEVFKEEPKKPESTKEEVVEESEEDLEDLFS